MLRGVVGRQRRQPLLQLGRQRQVQAGGLRGERDREWDREVPQEVCGQ